MHENIRCFGKMFDDFHAFAAELSRAADDIVLSETWFSANTCHDAQGYTDFHTYRADKTGGGVSVACLSEIVTPRPIWPIFHCVMYSMSSVW